MSTVVPSPACQRDGDELRAVASAQFLRIAALLGDTAQSPNNEGYRQVQADLNHHCFPIEVLKHIGDLEAAPPRRVLLMKLTDQH